MIWYNRFKSVNEGIYVYSYSTGSAGRYKFNVPGSTGWTMVGITITDDFKINMDNSGGSVEYYVTAIKI